MLFSLYSNRKGQILSPRSGRHQLPRPPDRTEREPFRDEVEDIRHTAAHHARLRRAAVRSHRRLPGEIHEGGEHHEGAAGAWVHVQLSAETARIN